MAKSTKEIEEFKKEQDRLVVEKVHLWDNRVRLEEVVSDACQHVFESTEELDVLGKAMWLGVVIAQLKRDNVDLQALVHPDTPPEQVVKRKIVMEYLAKQLEEMDQEAKKVTETTTQFWGSIVQDEKLEQLTTQSQKAKGQLAKLKTSLRVIPPVVQITNSV